MAATYRQIPALLRAREPFKGNSMSARLEDGIYTVYSYVTPIASVALTYDGQDPLSYGAKYVSDRKYGRTTSRHQGLCRAWL